MAAAGAAGLETGSSAAERAERLLARRSDVEAPLPAGAAGGEAEAFRLRGEGVVWEELGGSSSSCGAAAPPRPTKEASQSSFAVLSDRLSEHCKGRRAAVRARRLFLRNFQISILVASWVVIISLPIIIWPWADRIKDWGCEGLDGAACWMKRPECSFKFDRSTVSIRCVASRPNPYLSLYGTLVLQFLFSVYTDLGSTVKFTLQGLFGTLLACANMLLLDNALGPPLGMSGGAFGDQLIISSRTAINSYWLPLCNTGTQRLATKGAVCIFNIWPAKMTLSGTLKVTVVWIDFLIFVWTCLYMKFDANTRIFALSTHLYFMMAFVNPSADTFYTRPGMATHYTWMILAASVAALLCFLLPRKRFTALEAAEGMAREAVRASAALVGCLCGTLAEETLQKAMSASSETVVLLQELDQALAMSWFEDLGWGRCAWRRRALRSLTDRLRVGLRRIPGLHRAAAALSLEERELLRAHLGALTSACRAAECAVLHVGYESLGEPPEVSDQAPDPVEELHRALADAAGSIPKKSPQQPSPEAYAFLFALSGALSRVAESVDEIAQEVRQERRRGRKFRDRLRGLLNTLKTHFGDTLVDRTATHPRFVLRNTLSITLAFGFGWVGLWNVMPAYSSYPASTISVIVYTYTGSTAPVTIRRVAGVVLGKVLGAIVMLGFAVRTWYFASLFSTAMFCIVAFAFFLYLHADQELSGVFCLIAAFAASGMIPPNGSFRDANGAPTFSEVLPGLCFNIIETVIGVTILTVVDLSLGSSAKKQASQRLQRTLKRCGKYIVTVLSSPDTLGAGQAKERAKKFYDDLDALHDVIPFAVGEPSLWGQPFHGDLYKTLETHLRNLGGFAETIGWALLPPVADSSWSAPPTPTPRAAVETDAAFDRPDVRHTLGKVKQEMTAILKKMEAEVEGVTRDTSLSEEEVQELHRQLRANLYSAQALRRLVSISRAAAANLRGRVAEKQSPRGVLERVPVGDGRGAAARGHNERAEWLAAPRGHRRVSFSPERPEALCRRFWCWLPRAVRRFFSLAAHETLEADFSRAHTRHPGVASIIYEEDSGTCPPVQAMEESLRAAAAEEDVPCHLLPHEDPVCRAEVVISSLKAICLEVRKIELSLLEYSVGGGELSP